MGAGRETRRPMARRYRAKTTGARVVRTARGARAAGILNTKGHKERRDGMYRSTKSRRWRAATGRVASRYGAVSHRGRCACEYCVGKWRRDHDIAPGARPCRAPCRGQSRGMQNSQRVLLAKPRTAVASRWGAQGARGARGEAAHRAVARRRDGDIAPYRQAARAGRTATGRTATGRGEGVRGREVRRTAPKRRGTRGGARRGGVRPGDPAADGAALPRQNDGTRAGGAAMGGGICAGVCQGCFT